MGQCCGYFQPDNDIYLRILKDNNISSKNYDIYFDENGKIQRLLTYNEDKSIHVEFKFSDGKLTTHTEYDENYKNLEFNNLIDNKLIVTKEVNLVTMCNGCQVKKPNYIIIPCGHAHMCHSCHCEWLKTNKNICYLCENIIERYQVIYI